MNLYLRGERKSRRFLHPDWAGGVACFFIILLILWFGVLPSGLLGVVQQALSL